MTGSLRSFFAIVFLGLVTSRLNAQSDLLYGVFPWQWNASVTGSISNISLSHWADGGDEYSYVAGLKFAIDPSWSDGRWSFIGSWDGRFATFGGKSLPPRKTEDRLELNGKIGRVIWSTDSRSLSLHVTAFVNLLTQFLPDYDFIGDPKGTHYISNFMAPGYVTDGLGLDLRSDSLNLSVTITPIASKQTLVLDRGIDVTYFGVDPGRRTESSLGAYARITFAHDIFERTRFNVKTILFSDYSERSTVDLSGFAELDFRVTDYLTVFTSLQILNDDDMKIRLYADLDGDGSSDDFAGIGHGIQLYGQLGVGVTVSF